MRTEPTNTSDNNPVEIEIPLFEFFTALRQYDRQSLGRQGLGPEEFILLLEQLAQGYGLQNEGDLYTLCKLLWFKPYHTEKVFKYLFDQYLTDRIHRLIEKYIKENKEADPNTTNDQQKVNGEENNSEKNKDKSKIEEDQKEADKQNTSAGDKKEEDAPSLQVPKEKAAFRNVFLDFRATDEGGVPTDEDPQAMPRELKNRIYQKQYRLRGTYFPLKSRLMQQSFQLVREISREGRKDTINWEGTIDKVAREGFFQELVMMASPEVRSNLHILIDHEGSMVAFDDLTQIMVESLKKYTGKKTQIYYFRNCPVQFIYENPAHTRAIRIEQFFSGKSHPVIIVSDAGAARGFFDRGRLQRTREFLEGMRKHRIVWLNPIPSKRWEGSTADYIHSLVPMYELNEIGFVNAIKSLKLKHRRR